MAGQKLYSSTSYQAFDCCVREEGEIVLFFGRNCERFLYLEVKRKMFLTDIAVPWVVIIAGE